MEQSKVETENGMKEAKQKMEEIQQAQLKAIESAKSWKIAF